MPGTGFLFTNPKYFNMRNVLVLFAILCFATIACIAQTKDEAAIKAALQKETYSAYQRDYDAWASCWVHDNSAFIGWNNSNGTYDVRQGWDGVNELVKSWLTSSSETNHPDFINVNMLITVVGDLAYVNYDEYSAEKTGTKYTLTKIFKVLRKVGGDWKFVSVCSYWNYDYKFSKEEIK